MEQSIQQKNSAGYRADLVECIEKALIGQLSPSDQEYCFEEIKSLRGTDEYPPDGDHLLCQLHGILFAQKKHLLLYMDRMFMVLKESGLLVQKLHIQNFVWKSSIISVLQKDSLQLSTDHKV